MQLGQGMALQQVLSPQMQQSLALLQAPVMELRALVEQEMSVNPVLEEIAPGEREASAEVEAGGTRDGNALAMDPAEPPPDVLYDPATEKVNGSPVDDFQATLDRLVQMDQEWRDHFSQTQAPLRTSDEDDEKRQFLMDSLTQPVSMRGNLEGQLQMADMAPEVRMAAELVIGNLNDEGYLATPLSTLAETSQVSQELLEAGLVWVQSLEPAGIGARDLRECLLLQLERLGRKDSLEYTVVRDHLELLGRRRYHEIASKLGIYWDEVQDAAENIAKLRPRPGTELASVEPEYVVPEVTVTRAEDGGYRVSLNDEPLPKLRISHTYKDLLAQASSNQEVRDYLRDKIRAGKFLIRCLDQREQTIQRIAEEIVKRQREFFDKGRASLKPMTMAQVAEVVGVHETTVSRAVAAKYMDTPQGLIEMRSLFTSGVATANGGSVASTGVKELIGEMVRNEDPSHPLTDDQIETRLKAQGIQIARRTVAKYRGEMKILPVAMRRHG
ncbi:MAG: RNA polymerase factor sigma-54 [Limisphaerales bacterium]